jgi:hypothetical protein
MLKVDSCGIDVGSKEFVLTRRREGQSEPVRRTFSNGESGRRAVCRYLAKPGHVRSGLSGVNGQLRTGSGGGLGCL